MYHYCYMHTSDILLQKKQLLFCLLFSSWQIMYFKFISVQRCMIILIKFQCYSSSNSIYNFTVHNCIAMYRKVDLLWTNSHHHTKFHRARPNNVWEKRSKKLLHSSVFWCPREPWAKVHQSWIWCIASPHLSICWISSHSDNPSMRYLLPNFRLWYSHICAEKGR